jgi:hypothetical protein
VDEKGLITKNYRGPWPAAVQCKSINAKSLHLATLQRKNWPLRAQTNQYSLTNLITLIEAKSVHRHRHRQRCRQARSIPVVQTHHSLRSYAPGIVGSYCHLVPVDALKRRALDACVWYDPQLLWFHCYGCNTRRTRVHTTMRGYTIQMDGYVGTERHRSALLGLHSGIPHSLCLGFCMCSEPLSHGQHGPGLHHPMQ